MRDIYQLDIFNKLKNKRPT